MHRIDTSLSAVTEFHAAISCRNLVRPHYATQLLVAFLCFSSRVKPSECIPELGAVLEAHTSRWPDAWGKGGDLHPSRGRA